MGTIGGFLHRRLNLLTNLTTATEAGQTDDAITVSGLMKMPGLEDVYKRAEFVMLNPPLQYSTSPKQPNLASHSTTAPFTNIIPGPFPPTPISNARLDFLDLISR